MSKLKLEEIMNYSLDENAESNKEMARELISRDIGRTIVRYLFASDIDFNKIAQTNAVKALEEIKKIIHSELDDFMKVDEIVNVFGKFDIDAGGCHDF